MKRLMIAALAALTACTTATVVDRHDLDYRVIAYVRPRTDMARIGAEKLTHINYAFGKVSSEGDVVIEPEAPAHFAQLNALKARNPKLKVLLSVGGWGADNFSEAALTDDSRRRFARSAVAILDQYGLDGVDLDWEYPGQAGPGISFRPEDRENFTLLLGTLREHLGSRLLTIASSAGRYFEHTEMGRLHPYLDFVNLMTYDFAGRWSEMTGHHTALFAPAAAPDGPSTADFVEQHLRAGIPAEKIVIGVAFYGRSWKGVTGGNNGLYRPYEAYDVDLPYERIASEYLTSPKFERFWDASARAPYLWDRENGRFVTYDDPQSLQEKARFVKQRRLGGMMYWEHSHDPQETLLDTIVRELKRPGS